MKQTKKVGLLKDNAYLYSVTVLENHQSFISEPSINTLRCSDQDTKQTRNSFLISPLSCSAICSAPSAIHLNKCHSIASTFYVAAWISATGLLDFVFMSERSKKTLSGHKTTICCSSLMHMREHQVQQWQWNFLNINLNQYNCHLSGLIPFSRSSWLSGGISLRQNLKNRLALTSRYCLYERILFTASVSCCFLVE